MRLRSLYGRLVFGAIFWTVGILVVAGAIGTVIAQSHPQWRWLVHNSLLTLTGVVLVTAGLQVIRRGLSPFVELRQKLAAVRDGRTPRLDGDYPTEVAPLVDDLNLLLEEREQRVARAVAKAGDLAHGLKTPLAILAQDVARAEAAGDPELAASIRVQVERMRRTIASHLAQARASASGAGPTARTPLAEAVRGLVRTMERLYADRTLTIRAHALPAEADALVRVPLEDLEEMLGNLLDNACKWARARVSISARAADGRVTIDVDDDGAGLAPSMREAVLRRGVRADETAVGSGLGLAIVRDLAEAYGGTIALERAPDGGVRARLTLPSAG